MGEVLRAFAAAMKLPERESPLAWIERHVNLDADPISVAEGMVRLDPCQRDPILAQFDARVREVAIMAIEQTGKSTCWRLPLLYKLVNFPAPRWVIYESDEKAEDINAESLHPLIMSLPELAGQVNRRTATKRRYQFPNGSVLDFSGAGADITSKARCDGVADELDTWPLIPEEVRRNLDNFRKRFRTYWARGRGCLVIVSSPKGESSAIAETFDATSKGYWHLRCDGCGNLTMPSHAIYNLQFARADDGAPVPGSARLKCPACGHDHEESRAVAMNAGGGYVHERADVLKRRGFQWGALACPRVCLWQDIAEAQVGAGKSAAPRVQATFDNSWRGLAFRPRKSSEPLLDQLRAHQAPPPDPDKVAAVFLSADTQDAGWWYVVRAVDTLENTHGLDCGFVKTKDELLQAWNRRYLGILPTLAIVDVGGHGHRPADCWQIVDSNQGWYGYKGNMQIGTRYKLATERTRYILANHRQYQADLLYYLYTHRERGRNYWYLPPSPAAHWLEHLAALRQPKQGVNSYERWEPAKDSDDHLFDAEKMWLVLLDFARGHLPENAWRRKLGVRTATAAASPAPRRRPIVKYEG